MDPLLQRRTLSTCHQAAPPYLGPLPPRHQAAPPGLDMYGPVARSRCPVARAPPGDLPPLPQK
eukprot:scaffold123692_cov28-Tisochrysis_lutea.AAC.3